jgi:hypothetical protein
MATLQIALPDSEVSSVQWEGPDLLLRLSAARVVASAGPTGAHSAVAYLPGVVLRLAQAHLTGHAPDGVGRLSDAGLSVQGQPHKTVPLPCHWDGPVILTLAFANGTQLQAQGTGLAAAQVGNRPAVEHLSC